MTEITTANSTQRFDRSAWLTLGVALAFLVACFALLVYRFNLPMDGWLASEPEGFDSYGLIYDQNVMGFPSDLQAGDHLVAVEGISLQDKPSNPFYSLRSRWQAGTQVDYTIERDGQTMGIMVPLGHWRWSTFLLNPEASLGDSLTSLGIFIFLLVGFVVFFKRPGIPAARALFVLGGCLMGIQLGLGPMNNVISDMVFQPANLALEVLITLTFNLLLPPAFIRFSLVFPRPNRILERHPWIANLPYLIGILGVFAFSMGFFVYGWAWMSVSTLVTILMLIYNAVSLKDAVSRAQMRWGLGGLTVGLGIFFLSFLTIFARLPEAIVNLIDSWSSLGFGVMGVALGIAILRYRLFDIDVIIRRTLQYTLLTGLLGLVYFGSVVVGQKLAGVLFGSRESPLVLVISTLLIAAVFYPLRSRVQDFIDRRFYRRKYDAMQTLADFTKTARDETQLEVLKPALLEAVQDSVQPERAWLWLKEPERSNRR